MKKVLVWTASVLAVLVVVALGAGGWYYSGMVIDPARGPASYPIEVTAVSGGQVTLKGGGDTDSPGMYGLTWAGGSALVGPVSSVSGDDVTRLLIKVRKGELKPGVRAYLDRWMYGDEDPTSALGLPYEKVSIKGYPAWRLDGAAKTWVIAVHGRNANPSETLRVMPFFHRLGMPVLSIGYRNDRGAPASDDGKFHLGASEWEEVAAAVSYAQSQGASDVILYGWSMGGAIVTTAARKMPDAPIKGIIMDSPVLDWTPPIEAGAREQGVPVWFAGVAKFIVERRTGISFDDLDQVKHASAFKTPMLIFADSADTGVPMDAAAAFAKARQDLVTFVQTDGGGHVGSWNVDQARYERALADFVS